MLVYPMSVRQKQPFLNKNSFNKTRKVKKLPQTQTVSQNQDRTKRQTNTIDVLMACLLSILNTFHILP